MGEMGEKTKLAVAPPIQVGGSLFTPQQLVRIGSIVGAESAIEMTSFKQMYVEVSTDRLEQVTEELVQAGLEVYPAGFVTKSLIACQFCRGAEEAGLDIARKLNNAIAGIPAPTPLKIGYAGCGLGTSEPLFKDIGIVKTRDTYQIYVGGEPKGLKVSAAQLLAGDVPEDALISAVRNIIDSYREHAKGKEKFSKFVGRVTVEQLKSYSMGRG